MTLPMPATLKALTESNWTVIMVTSRVCFSAQPGFTVESCINPRFWTGGLASRLWNVRSLGN